MVTPFSGGEEDGNEGWCDVDEKGGVLMVASRWNVGVDGEWEVFGDAPPVNVEGEKLRG